MDARRDTRPGLPAMVEQLVCAGCSEIRELQSPGHDWVACTSPRGATLTLSWDSRRDAVAAALHRDRRPPQKLPQHVLQDPPVLVVRHVHRAVEPRDRLELVLGAILPPNANRHLHTRLQPAGYADQVERLPPGQLE